MKIPQILRDMLSALWHPFAVKYAWLMALLGWTAISLTAAAFTHIVFHGKSLQANEAISKEAVIAMLVVFAIAAWRGLVSSKWGR